MQYLDSKSQKSDQLKAKPNKTFRYKVEAGKMPSLSGNLHADYGVASWALFCTPRFLKARIESVSRPNAKMPNPILYDNGS